MPHFKGDEIKEGDIRLVGGSYLWHGRVEIYLSGVWGIISYYGTSYNAAKVVCRQLGYNTYSKVYYISICIYNFLCLINSNKNTAFYAKY